MEEEIFVKVEVEEPVVPVRPRPHQLTIDSSPHNVLVVGPKPQSSFKVQSPRRTEVQALVVIESPFRPIEVLGPDNSRLENLRLLIDLKDTILDKIGLKTFNNDKFCILQNLSHYRLVSVYSHDY
jgi:hypothetical protein